MLEAKRRPPRSPEDHRMNLYHDTFRGRLRRYVKVSKTGRRIDITKAWAAKFKKFARLAGVNEPKKNCHGVRKACAEVAAYSECTEALYIAKASRDKLAISGMEKIEAYDQMENIVDLAMPIDQNRIVTFESNRRKKP
jgi:hypothetical protein